MNKKLPILFFCFALWLSACAQFDVRSGYKLEPKSQKGVLALGITASDDMPNFYWHLRKIGTTDTKDVTFYTIQNPLMWTNPRGRLATIELDEGDYELFDWGIVFGFAPTEYFRIPFTVKAGRVTYLGRVHLELDKPQKRFTVESTNSSFADDYRVVEAKMADLTSDLVDQQQATFQSCADASCAKPQPVPRRYTVVIPIVVH